MAAFWVQPLRLTLRVPVRAAWGVLAERDLLRVTLAFSDDDWGEGEAAPLEAYDGVPLAAVAAALQVYQTLLNDIGPDVPHAAILAACAAERPLPQALAALDLALWDRAGRRAGRPVAELLAGPERTGDSSPPGGGGAAPDEPAPGPASDVAVNATIGAEDRAGAATEAANAAREGFGCVKVKVGVGDDAGRLAAVRAAVGPSVAIRADANGAWATPAEALANLRALAPIGLELCEEPVHGLEAMRAVRAASPVPVAMDETAAEPGAAASRAADAVCLKVARCGGITGLLREARAARTAGAGVYVASTFDGPLGIAAGIHAAAALAATGPVAHCGLATLSAFAEPQPAELAPREGAIAVPRAPGLGAG